MIPKHFSLVKEHPNSYEIHDKRDGKKFHIAKSGLDLGMHAKLSKIQHFSDGGKPVLLASNAEDSPEQIASEAQSSLPPAPEPSFAQNLGSAVRGSVGDAAHAFGTVLGKPLSAVAGAGKDFVQGLLPAEAAAAEPEAAPAESRPQSIASAEMAPAAQPSTAASIEPAVAQQMTANSALDAEKTALLEGAKAEGDASKKTATAYGEMSNKLDAMLTPQQIMANHQDADNELMKGFMSKSVDPDHYWNNKTTGQKVLAGLGMILGGLGSGLSGGPNMAMQVIHNAIDRDMESQKMDQSKAMNLWKMNRDATQNEMQANLATQNQMLLGVKAKALQYASQAAGPEAQARLAPLIAQIDQQTSMNNFHRSMLSAAGQGGVLNVDPSAMLSIIPEKERPQATKEIANAQEIKKLKDDFQNSFDTLAKMPLAGWKTNDRDSAVNAFAGRIAKLSEGRFNLEEAKLQAQALLPGATDMGKTRPHKQDRLNRFFDSMVTSPTFKANTGIDLNRFASTNLTPTPIQEAPQTATRNGVQYVKVAGGWRPAQ